MANRTEVTFSSRDACRLADITFRQLDYWCRLGTITPAVPASGSGSQRRWNAQQVAVLAVLARVGGHVPISQLDELGALLMDWDYPAWKGTVLLVTPGGVWVQGDEGDAPAVAVAVDLGRVLVEVKARAQESRGSRTP